MFLYLLLVAGEGVLGATVHFTLIFSAASTSAIVWQDAVSAVGIPEQSSFPFLLSELEMGSFHGNQDTSFLRGTDSGPGWASGRQGRSQL